TRPRHRHPLPSPAMPAAGRTAQHAAPVALPHSLPACGAQGAAAGGREVVGARLAQPPSMAADRPQAPAPIRKCLRPPSGLPPRPGAESVIVIASPQNRSYASR
ncbi:hypothetical protein, partial [Achromobacter denitrificans]|uniref:hypothetical protein n=1 Tax=Achromobacter denitrificans TaxID=32002 RepID=UPI001C8BAD2A